MKDSNFREGYNRYGYNPSSQPETAANKKAAVQKKNKPSAISSQVKADNTAQPKEDPINKFMALKASKEAATVQKKKNEEGEIQLRKDELSPVPIQQKEQDEKIQLKETTPAEANNTGLPDNLKAGVENLSGLSMDHVKVHYNSDKPAQLQAHAFAQGSDIHVAPGQEKHLPHEAWHVVQQEQDRVKPTVQMKNKVNINDDAALENEADLMGEKAITAGNQLNSDNSPLSESKADISQRKSVTETDTSSTTEVAQLKVQTTSQDSTSYISSTQSSIQPVPITNAPPELKSNLLPCGHESPGVVQRMITKNPDQTDDIEALEKYVFGTKINAKGQTFDYAVRSSGQEGMLKTIINALNEGNGKFALLKILEVIDAINRSEAKEPNHPNQVWKGSNAVNNAKAHDAPYSISKTPDSIEKADRARKIILQNKIIKDDKFMMGVLVLPDGQLIIALSGSRSELLDPIGQALIKEGMPLYLGQVYDVRSISRDDNTTYRKAASEGVKKYEDLGEDDEGKIVRKRGSDKEDLGSYPATCAAAVALSVAKSVNAKAFEGGGIMGLTEVFVSTNEKSEVLIYNKDTGEGDRFNMKSKDVPSCHVCQLQLEDVAKEVVALEKNGILTSLKKEMIEKSVEMTKMEKELEGMKIANAKDEPLARAQEQWEALLQEALEAQDEIFEQLNASNKAIEKYNAKITDITLAIEKKEEIIRELSEKSKSLASEINGKSQAIAMVEAQEKEIETLKKKVALLEKDESELKSLASSWNMLNGYSGWYQKVQALQKTKDFKDVSDKEISGKLTEKITVEKAALDKKQKHADQFLSSSDLKKDKTTLDTEKKGVNSKKTSEENDLRTLKAKKGKVTTSLEKSKRENSSKEAEFEEAQARARDLQAKFDESSEAAQNLQKTEKQIRKSEAALMRIRRDLKRMEMTFNAYSS